MRVQEPVISLAVFALCADTREEAEAYEFSPEEVEYMANRRGKQILGTQDRVVQQLTDLAERAGAEELAIVSITHDFQARLRCYELLAAIDWGVSDSA